MDKKDGEVGYLLHNHSTNYPAIITIIKKELE